MPCRRVRWITSYTKYACNTRAVWRGRSARARRGPGGPRLRHVPREREVTRRLRELGHARRGEAAIVLGEEGAAQAGVGVEPHQLRLDLLVPRRQPLLELLLREALRVVCAPRLEARALRVDAGGEGGGDDDDAEEDEQDRAAAFGRHLAEAHAGARVAAGVEVSSRAPCHRVRILCRPSKSFHESLLLL